MIKNRSISRIFAGLILLATLPAVLILLYSGSEQKSRAYRAAEKEIRMLVHSMAEVQQNSAEITRQILSTLSLLAEFRELNLPRCREILADMVKNNPGYVNFVLAGPGGEVLASGLPLDRGFLGDRLHVGRALREGVFSSGEYIVARTVGADPSFPFAYPVRDREGEIVAVLSTAIKLTHFSRFQEGMTVTDRSIVAITDYQGIRLYYYPVNEGTNPLGQPIKAEAWEHARETRGPEVFRMRGSDGFWRIYGVEGVSLSPELSPYLYIWAAIPEEELLRPVLSRMILDLAAMFLVILLSLSLAWVFGRKMILAPIRLLIGITRRIQQGEPLTGEPLPENEFGTLAEAFYSMTETLLASRASLEQNQHRLQEETERLAVTLKSIGDGVITTDSQGRILLFNQAAEKITGWSAGEAAGQEFVRLFPEVEGSSGKGEEQGLSRVIAAGGAAFQSSNSQLRVRNGEIVRVSLSGAPILDEKGRVLGAVMVFRDISSRIRMEKEMLRMEKLESVGVLAGGIAHDFNNILTVILGNVEMALSDSRLGPATAELLEEAGRAADRAKDLTAQLLTFAKGGAPVKEPFDLPGLVREEAAALEEELENCRMVFSFAPGLRQVEGDRDQIGRVIRHLFLNAGQAMPEGGEISVAAGNISGKRISDRGLPAGREYVELTVTDQGKGIDEAVLGRIFDPYFSIGSQQKGLGLAISHSIVARHGGQMAVESLSGGGTGISLYLPAIRSSRESAGASGPGDAAVPAARILIMDDEDMVRTILATMLKSLGHEVLQARDGEEAVALFRESLEKDRPVDLVITDLTVNQGMGGLEAASLILGMNPRMKMIVSSGYSDDPVMAEFGRYGFSGAIKKPYTLKELRTGVNEVLARREAGGPPGS